MARETLELLESLLVERKMDSDRTDSDKLDALLAACVPEDLHLEYKHGDELKKDKPSATLRQYMSGFANSAGGVLMIGADDEWNVTGCSAPGGGDPDKWASDCIVPIASHFSQRPEFCLVNHPNGKVLVAWTARSLNLVPCYEGGKWVYYFRFHDKTLSAPDYLISDLMLGRRQHPYLRVTECQLIDFRIPSPDNGAALEFRPSITIENEGLSWAEGVIWGIVGWDREKRNPPSDYLRSNIEICNPAIKSYSGPRYLYHAVSAERPGASMAPFTAETLEIRWNHILPIRMHSTWYRPYIWQAALYLLPKGSPPVWYQLRLSVTTKLLEYAQVNDVLCSDGKFLALERLPGGGPVVSWQSQE